MQISRLLISGLLSCTMLVGCDGKDSKAPSEVSRGTFEQLQEEVRLHGEITAALKQRIAELEASGSASNASTQSLIAELKLELTNEQKIQAGQVRDVELALKALREKLDGIGKDLTQLKEVVNEKADKTALDALIAEYEELKTAIGGAFEFTGTTLITLGENVNELEARIAALESSRAELTCNAATSDGMVSCDIPFESRPVVSVPAGTPTTELLKAAANATPTPQIYKWQLLELIGFIHYGINATYLADPVAHPGYQNNGTGDEDAKLFNPVNLDPKAWVKTFKDAGFKMIVITAKHHNGFKLWPAKTNDFTVANSSWAGIEGNKDLLKAFTDAAHAEGIKIGVYLSPSDLYAHRHQKSKVVANRTVFGNGSAAAACQVPSNAAGVAPNRIFTYQVDEYNCDFLRDLYDIITGYGELTELWFDGYDPTRGAQKYAFDKWFELINEIQPGIALFNSYWQGQALTWVGNEEGHARETRQWSVLPTNSAAYPANLIDFPGRNNEQENDRGSASFLNTHQANVRAFWWAPAESPATVAEDTAWFYNPAKRTLSSAELMRKYLSSVGRNSNLILNVGPRADGTLAPTDVAAMKALGNNIRGLYTNKIEMTASAERSLPAHPPAATVDNSPDTYWTYPTSDTWTYSANTEWNAETLTLATKDGKPATFNLLVIQEDIRQGQAIESVVLERWNDDNQTWIAWGGENSFDRAAASGTLGTIGYKRIVYLEKPLTSSKIRLRIRQARKAPAISNVSVYNTDWRPSGPDLPATTCTQTSIAFTTRGTSPCQWNFTSDWKFADGATSARSNDVSGTATIRFSGVTGFTYRGERSASGGIVAVTLNGGTPEFIDLYSANTSIQDLFNKTGLDPNIVNVLQISPTGRRNTNATDSYASVSTIELKR